MQMQLLVPILNNDNKSSTTKESTVLMINFLLRVLDQREPVVFLLCVCLCLRDKEKQSVCLCVCISALWTGSRTGDKLIRSRTLRANR